MAVGLVMTRAVLACGCPARAEEARGLLAGQAWADTSSEEPAGSVPLVGGPGGGGPPRRACYGARVLRAHGGLCRAGRPKRSGFAGPRVPSSCRAQPHTAPQEGSARQVAVQHAGVASAPAGRVPHSQPRLRPRPFHMPPPLPCHLQNRPSQGRGSGGKARGSRTSFPARAPCSVLRSMGARASLWPSWPLGLPALPPAVLARLPSSLHPPSPLTSLFPSSVLPSSVGASNHRHS